MPWCFVYNKTVLKAAASLRNFISFMPKRLSASGQSACQLINRPTDTTKQTIEFFKQTIWKAFIIIITKYIVRDWVWGVTAAPSTPLLSVDLSEVIMSVRSLYQDQLYLTPSMHDDPSTDVSDNFHRILTMNFHTLQQVQLVLIHLFFSLFTCKLNLGNGCWLKIKALNASKRKVSK